MAQEYVVAPYSIGRGHIFGVIRIIENCASAFPAP